MDLDVLWSPTFFASEIILQYMSSLHKCKLQLGQELQ